MSEEESGDFLMPIPDANAPIEWLGFSLMIDFYPSIKLSRKTGLEFTADLSEILEPENVHLEANEWRIHGAGVCEGITLVVKKRQVQLYVSPDSLRLERYEQRIKTLLEVFEEKFEPRVALRSNVDVTGLVALPGDGDARVFLGGYVMLMRPARLNTIDRPLDILGVRLNFPPYEDVNWGVNVRIESWAEDPKKVFLNADADWESQSKWDSEFVGKLCEQITTVTTFMSTKLMQFLREPPFSPDELEEEDGNDQ